MHLDNASVVNAIPKAHQVDIPTYLDVPIKLQIQRLVLEVCANWRRLSSLQEVPLGFLLGSNMQHTRKYTKR